MRQGNTEPLLNSEHVQLGKQRLEHLPFETLIRSSIFSPSDKQKRYGVTLDAPGRERLPC